MTEKIERQEILSHKLIIPNNFVVIVGCGGSGFNVAIQAAMAGCKKFILIDHDILEEHNRNRLWSKISDIGRSKVDILATLLKEQDAEEIIIYNQQATYKLLQNINMASSISAIVSCVDRFHAIQMINNFCKDFNIRMIRAGSDDDKISYGTDLGCLIDMDGEDGYQIFPNWIGGSMLSATLATYLLLYPDLNMPVTTISVFSALFHQGGTNVRTS